MIEIVFESRKIGYSRGVLLERPVRVCYAAYRIMSKILIVTEAWAIV